MSATSSTAAVGEETAAGDHTRLRVADAHKPAQVSVRDFTRKPPAPLDIKWIRKPVESAESGI
jgi:hypothetical protein